MYHLLGFAFVQADIFLKGSIICSFQCVPIIGFKFPGVVCPRGTPFALQIFSSTHRLGETGLDRRTDEL
jgi:hypothetical protein